MNTWKIKNITQDKVKITVITSSTSSRGLILNPGEFCLGKPQLTAPLDAQRRRGLIEIDEKFDNSEYNFELGVAITESALTAAKLSKLEKAKRDAKEYAEKNK